MTQRILVFQQRGSGEKKIKGIREFGDKLFRIETISIDQPLPAIIEDTTTYLPEKFEADLVLDFVKHPDLSLDISVKCSEMKIPVVASGKKWPHAFTPAT